MPFRFALPDLGEGVAEGEILRYLVTVGDEVAEDDPLVEVETDKSGVDLPSPVAGRVTAVHGSPGDVVAVGTVLVEIRVEGDVASPPSDEGGEVRPTGTAVRPAASGPPGADVAAVAATPKVRRLAADLGVALGAVTATGPGGRLTEADVRAAAPAPAEPAHTAQTPPAVPTSTATRPGSRRTIARRLTEAAAVPTVTNVDDCDFTAVRRAGVSPLTAVARACVVALGAHPGLNAWHVDGELRPQSAVHLGIATQSERGLVVPVVRNAGALDVDALRAGIGTVSTAAREGRTAPDDLRGSTFTITSAGTQAGLFSTPLLNLPEVAVLGLYRLEPRPVVRDGEVVVATMANLSITFDHRVLDGLAAAAFLGRVKELVQTWP